MSTSSGSIHSMSPPQLSPSGGVGGVPASYMQLRLQRPTVLEFSAPQWDALEAHFARVKNPHPTDLLLLAAEIGRDESEVQAWYSQRLAAWRKEQGLNPVSGRVD
ncbi:hypothetical protein B566_EDAN001713 [Ephemera danica]|nr:hypothetical protein B566_EDAN001713 [Ephemera danica]